MRLCHIQSNNVISIGCTRTILDNQMQNLLNGGSHKLKLTSKNCLIVVVFLGVHKQKKLALLTILIKSVSSWSTVFYDLWCSFTRRPCWCWLTMSVGPLSPSYSRIRSAPGTQIRPGGHARWVFSNDWYSIFMVRCPGVMGIFLSLFSYFSFDALKLVMFNDIVKYSSTLSNHFWPSLNTS